MAFLEVKNITKTFGNNEVLKGIDFTVERGEVLSIIGSSGSGKTTLLRCINFLERPDTGEITVGGEVVLDEQARLGKLSERELRERRLHFGLVFQSFNLFPQYTARQNLTLAAELQVRERLKAEGKSKDRAAVAAELQAISDRAESMRAFKASQSSLPGTCQRSGELR